MLQRRLRMRLGIVIICTCATSLMGLLASTSTALASDKNGCSAAIDNPHNSSGAGGVIAKGRWECNDTPTTIFLNFTHGSAGLNLWLCTDKEPEKTETYLEDDSSCFIWGSNDSNIRITLPEVTYTLYVPPSGEIAGAGEGWWVACAVWASQGPGGTGSPVTTFSNVVYINNL